ncbi:protein trichome birefringence-like 43 [Papaver somniferum]|uniref:protein trichome birefringence-like 43 n=1 Tax=Papaver somniferum TaxID=3469 RepID=UPI000E700D8F|nr:protein trichome birefringence-like 43 [Papaver somniferum]
MAGINKKISAASARAHTRKRKQNTGLQLPMDNGRPNKDYLKYKWSPSGCPAPKFDGQDLVKRVKGKKIMFVGDSVSQNQWQSFSFLIHAAIPNAKYAINYGEKYSSVNFTDPEYDIASIFNQKPFFVELEGKPERVLKIDTISTSDVWKEIDILVLNSWHWWHHTGKLQHWDKIQEGAQTYKDIDDRMEAFKKGLTTWSTWVDKNIDPKKEFLLLISMATSGVSQRRLAQTTQRQLLVANFLELRNLECLYSRNY